MKFNWISFLDKLQRLLIWNSLKTLIKVIKFIKYCPKLLIRLLILKNNFFNFFKQNKIEQKKK